ncbi:MAG: hypothetical protein ACOCSK_00890 [Rhodothermales bacterium]
MEREVEARAVVIRIVEIASVKGAVMVVVRKRVVTREIPTIRIWPVEIIAIEGIGRVVVVNNHRIVVLLHFDVIGFVVAADVVDCCKLRVTAGEPYQKRCNDAETHWEGGHSKDLLGS